MLKNNDEVYQLKHPNERIVSLRLTRFRQKNYMKNTISISLPHEWVQLLQMLQQFRSQSAIIGLLKLIARITSGIADKLD